eukprot:1663900-Rhodomonas_salina.2
MGTALAHGACPRSLAVCALAAASAPAAASLRPPQPHHTHSLHLASSAASHQTPATRQGPQAWRGKLIAAARPAPRVNLSAPHAPLCLGHPGARMAAARALRRLCRAGLRASCPRNGASNCDAHRVHHAGVRRHWRRGAGPPPPPPPPPRGASSSSSPLPAPAPQTPPAAPPSLSQTSCNARADTRHVAAVER